ERTECSAQVPGRPRLDVQRVERRLVGREETWNAVLVLVVVSRESGHVKLLSMVVASERDEAREHRPGSRAPRAVQDSERHPPLLALQVLGFITADRDNARRVEGGRRGGWRVGAGECGGRRGTVAGVGCEAPARLA